MSRAFAPPAAAFQALALQQRAHHVTLARTRPRRTWRLARAAQPVARRPAPAQQLYQRATCAQADMLILGLPIQHYRVPQEQLHALLATPRMAALTATSAPPAFTTKRAPPRFSTSSALQSSPLARRVLQIRQAPQARTQPRRAFAPTVTLRPPQTTSLLHALLAAMAAIPAPCPRFRQTVTRVETAPLAAAEPQRSHLQAQRASALLTCILLTAARTLMARAPVALHAPTALLLPLKAPVPARANFLLVGLRPPFPATETLARI